MSLLWGGLGTAVLTAVFNGGFTGDLSSDKASLLRGELGWMGVLLNELYRCCEQNSVSEQCWGA